MTLTPLANATGNHAIVCIKLVTPSCLLNQPSIKPTVQAVRPIKTAAIRLVQKPNPNTMAFFSSPVETRALSRSKVMAFR